ncbi:hypothetical protein [Sphingobium phenoxybenzoativorans]|uniref:hypothetical protein n=1 Tax=Sphingobium phenoxybenzoativorans TaxID=1592790 RepID=UPI000872C3C1|nr:hypothetical protein [Sphingobium phenoxybenzoativorans]
MTDNRTDAEVIANLRAEVAAARAEAFKRSEDFANQCVAVDFLKALANHFNEPFDTAVGAFQALSSNLHYVIHSPQGQSALSLCFIAQSGIDHDMLRPVLH